MYKLRDYQKNDIERIRTEYRKGARAVLHVSPTGSGKTVTFSHITHNAYKKNKSILILTHRDNLLRQTSKKLTECGLNHGVIAAGYPSIRYRIQVASVQTLVRRLKNWEHFDLIIIDEAAHTPAKSWTNIIDHFSKSKFYGCTATPIRLDGGGLGEYFDTMVVGPEFDYLVSQGFLSKPVYYVPEKIDLTGVRKTAGDWNRKDLNFRMDKRCITGNAIEYYSKYCENEPAMIFCVSISHAEHVAEEFNNAGYKTMAVHSRMKYEDIYNAIDGLSKGDIKVLTSCDIIGEGTDVPVLKAVIQLRPTQSLALNHQQNGRGSRPYPGKEYSIHIDHVGNCELHGLINWAIKWELTKGKFQPQIQEVRICQFCKKVFLSKLKKCPYCNMEVEKTAGRGRREIEVIDGKLKKIDYAALNKKIEKADSLKELRIIAKDTGYQPGWAWHQWKIKQKKCV